MKNVHAANHWVFVFDVSWLKGVNINIPSQAIASGIAFKEQCLVSLIVTTWDCMACPTTLHKAILFCIPYAFLVAVLFQTRYIALIFSNFSNSYVSFLLLAKEPLGKVWLSNINLFTGSCRLTGRCTSVSRASKGGVCKLQIQLWQPYSSKGLALTNFIYKLMGVYIFNTFLANWFCFWLTSQAWQNL